MNKLKTIAMTLCLVPVAAFAAELPTGGWVVKGVSCSALETYADERILKIKKRTIEFYESECLIRKVNKTGNKYAVELLCEGEGETYREALNFSIRPNGNLLIDAEEYVRCG